MNWSPSEVSAEVRASVDANNEFAIDLYSHLARGEDGDLFFSPSSISLALAMTYAGAAGDTADEIARAIHVTLPKDRFHQSLLELQKETKTGGVDFRIANRMWGQRDYNFLESFLQTTEQYYGARLAEADFINDAEATRLEINDWVAHKTNQQIKELISPSGIGELSRLVLANAVYFLGNWDNEFEQEATFDADFHVEAGRTKTVRMMQQTDYFWYGDFDDLQVLEMPYQTEKIELQTITDGGVEQQVAVEVPDAGSNFAMTILLPRRRNCLGDIESRLSASTLRKWTTLGPARVAVQFPRFRMESSYFLSEPLKALGIRRAFEVEQADFSAMSDNPEGLFIGEAIHKAFVDVNEQGTEAAAATAVVMRGGSAGGIEPPKQFVADRPFLFLIRDRRTQQIHFMGKVCSPISQS